MTSFGPGERLINGEVRYSAAWLDSEPEEETFDRVGLLKDILAAIVGCGEAVALFAIEPLYNT